MSFEIAAFDPSGELVGTSRRRVADLSAKWLKTASAYLEKHGAKFKSNWGGALAHLTTQFTSEDGVALVTFFANDVLATSLLLLSGNNSKVERSALSMFVKSLRKIDLVRVTQIGKEPFACAYNIVSRPLMIVVPWGDERISEQDDELIQELATHLSAAFLVPFSGGM